MFYEACPEAFEAKPGRLRSEKFPYLRNIIFMGEIPYNGMYRWSELLDAGRQISRIRNLPSVKNPLSLMIP